MTPSAFWFIITKVSNAVKIRVALMAQLNRMRGNMKDFVGQALLYDFYGELLNDHQKQVYEDFILNDLSLSEIAEEKGISRQGVHDLVKRCTKTLEGYEEKLHLVEKFINTKNKINKINDLTRQFELTKKFELVEQIQKISNEILEEF